MLREGQAFDPMERRLRDIVQRNGFDAAALNQSVIKAHNDSYTHLLAQGAITNQKSSGRCWIYAGLNMVRSELMAQGKVQPSFEFSENYLHFFSMLEKSNRYLERILANAGEKGLGSLFSRKQLKAALQPSVSDGGWFEWFNFLVAKYGMVPASAMPETTSSQDTRRLLTELSDKLAATASEMLDAAAKLEAGGIPLASEAGLARLRAVKQKGLTATWRILATHLGDPPVAFDLRLQGNYTVERGVAVAPAASRKVTPRELAVRFARYRPADFVRIWALPYRKSGTVYERKASAIGPEKNGDARFNLRLLNVDMDRMEQLAVRAIESGQPVWFAADVGQDVDHRTGIMHPAIFEREPVYNIPEGERAAAMTRERRMRFGVLSANHAMLLTGFDRPDPAGPVVKFRVENSWGDGYGSKGTYHMYRDWFRENVFEIVVHKSLLDGAERNAWDGPPTWIEEGDDSY